MNQKHANLPDHQTMLTVLPTFHLERALVRSFKADVYGDLVGKLTFDFQVANGIQWRIVERRYLAEVTMGLRGFNERHEDILFIQGRYWSVYSFDSALADRQEVLDCFAKHYMPSQVFTFFRDLVKEHSVKMGLEPILIPDHRQRRGCGSAD